MKNVRIIYMYTSVNLNGILFFAKSIHIIVYIFIYIKTE